MDGGVPQPQPEHYDFVKATVDHLVKNLTAEFADDPVTAVGVTPGWLRSERRTGRTDRIKETSRQTIGRDA
jgi:NAD(P)-dependent dehydrogenase (short-subunit alcohol dehydrogenase family)